MSIRYFDSIEELVSVVCNEMRGKWRKHGGVHVGRVFGVKRYADGSGELTKWDWGVTGFCSNIRRKLLLKINKPILAFVRASYGVDERVLFYVYYDNHLFSEREVEEIINEFNECIKNNLWVLKMVSG
jgi:hypothetical protein